MTDGARTAVVTGGARGIGRAIADRLAADGADVVVGDLVDPGDLGARQRWIHLDVSSENSADQFSVSCPERIDVLVNNAGIMIERSIADQTVAEWDEMMAINLRGPWLMTKVLLDRLRAAGGVVVNVGSIEGISSNPLHTAYAASKGGVHALTVAMAVDLGPLGIRCNAVAPGWIDTELNRQYIERLPDRGEAVAALADLHPVGRIGDPEDVAAVVAFLADADSGFVSGQVIAVDGGRMSRLALPQVLRPTKERDR